MRIKIQAGVVEHRGEHPVECVDVTVPVSEGDPCQPIQRRAGGWRLCGESSGKGARGRQPDIDAGRSQSISERNSKRGTVDSAEQSGSRSWAVGVAATGR